jgi:hypothetical protein
LYVHDDGSARHPPLCGECVMTRDVNEQNVWTVASTRDVSISTDVGWSVESRIRKSCLLSVTSASSALFPAQESLKSATHVSAETPELPKFERKRIDKAASSFGELFTWTLTVFDAVFV